MYLCVSHSPRRWMHMLTTCFELLNGYNFCGVLHMAGLSVLHSYTTMGTTIYVQSGGQAIYYALTPLLWTAVNLQQYK